MLICSVIRMNIWKLPVFFFFYVRLCNLHVKSFLHCLLRNVWNNKPDQGLVSTHPHTHTHRRSYRYFFCLRLLTLDHNCPTNVHKYAHTDFHIPVEWLIIHFIQGCAAVLWAFKLTEYPSQNYIWQSNQRAVACCLSYNMCGYFTWEISAFIHPVVFLGWA